jgi:hypothetical protein
MTNSTLNNETPEQTIERTKALETDFRRSLRYNGVHDAAMEEKNTLIETKALADAMDEILVLNELEGVAVEKIDEETLKVTINFDDEAFWSSPVQFFNWDR